MTSLRKVSWRFCKRRLSRGEAAAYDAYPHADRKRGLAKARTDIYFVDPRAFANDIPFEMESPLESARRAGSGQVDAHVYVRIREERNSCQSPSASMAKKLLRLKFSGTRIRATTTYFALLLRPRDPASARMLLYCTSKVYFTYRTGSIECYKFSRKWIEQDIKRYRRTWEILRCLYIFIANYHIFYSAFNGVYNM